MFFPVLRIRNPKNLFLSSRKYDPGWFIPDPDPDFLPIPDPGVQGSKRHHWFSPASHSRCCRELAGGFQQDNEERQLWPGRRGHSQQKSGTRHHCRRHKNRYDDSARNDGPEDFCLCNLCLPYIFLKSRGVFLNNYGSFVLLLSEGSFCCYMTVFILFFSSSVCHHALDRMPLASDYRKQIMEPWK